MKLLYPHMNIIVTGASRGIGYALVKILSGDPSHTIFAVSRNASRLEELKKACSGGNVIPMPCDLSDEKQVKSLVATLGGRSSSVDVLINNAGAIVNKPFQEISEKELRAVYDVNVFGVVRLIQQLLPLLKNSPKAHILNVSSMGGFQGSAKFAGLSAYSSSKAALVCLTECLAEEFKESNMKFNCLALGATQTEMLEEAFPGYKAPLQASQMAEFIADFALKAHFYINGKVVPVSNSTP